MIHSEAEILKWLDEVKDPEIPVLSLIDLGVVKGVKVGVEGVTVTITPTFVGCPALDLMKREIIDVLTRYGILHSEVKISYQEPWSTDCISEKGRVALKNFGLAPPPETGLFKDLDILEHALCPRCGGTNTEMKTPFGPTLCRSIHFCFDCRESFEQFKPL